MKNAKIACLIGFILFVLAIGISFAEENAKLVWNEENMPGDKIFSKRFFTTGCVILVHRSGTGVSVFSNDFDRNEWQYITIKKGRRVVESYRSTRPSKDGFLWFEETSGYDIFYVKYRESAIKQLPKAVKKLFGGCSGIE